MGTGRSLDLRMVLDRDGQASFSAAAVLLLVCLSFSPLLLGTPLSFRDRGGGEPTLDEASRVLRSCLSRALDEALVRAVPRAARDGGVDLASALDAELCRILPAAVPREVGDWSVSLVEARAGLSVREGGSDGPPGVAPCSWAPEARARLELHRRGSPATSLELEAHGPSSSPNRIVARAATLAGAMVDRGGPVAQEARSLLWHAAQGAAMTGGRVAEDLLTDGDVVEALGMALASLSGLPVPGRLGPPPPDLSALVRQGVQGALEANVGWVDRYLLGGGGLAGLVASLDDLSWAGPLLESLEGLLDLEERIYDQVGETVSRLALDYLEEVMGGLPPLVGDVGLEDLVPSSVRLLDEVSCILEARLACGGPDMALGRRMAGEVIGGVLEALGLGGVVEPPEELCMRAARLLDAASSAAARLGLRCARDVLLAIDEMGDAVPGIAPGSGTEVLQGSLVVDLLDLEVTTRWTGKVACEPGQALDRLVGLVLGSGPGGVPPLGALPYVASCGVRARGFAQVQVELPRSWGGDDGVRGGSIRTAWEVPVDLELVVPVATGWAMEGVVYEPSRTLAGDMAAATTALYEGLEDGVGWMAHRMGDAARWVGSQVQGLLEDMAESVLEESAYTLSQALWRIGEATVKRETGDAINGTWDLLMDLFGEDLKDRLTIVFDLWGCEVTVSLDVALQQLEVEVVRGDVEVVLALRRLCDPHPPFRAKPVDGYYWGVFGRASLQLGSGGALLLVDPLTLVQSAMVTLVARWGGDGGDGGTELTLEAVEARRQPGRVGVRLSELAGGPRLLSLGGRTGVDAGLVVHGEIADEGTVGEMLARAAKRAWLAAVRGWKVGDLVGETGRGPDAAMFLQVLFRELYAALVEEGEDLVAEVEAFCELDALQTAWPRVRLSLVVSRPLEVLLPLMAWVGRELANLVGWACSGSPGGAVSALGASLAEHVRVRTELLWTVAPPSWLAERVGEGRLPPEVGLVLRGEVNLAALAAMVGRDVGVWAASTEVLLRGVPGGALALVPGLGSARWRWAEVTLLRLTLVEAWEPKVLISRVLYDARGRDVDLELVELVNAGERMVDAGGLVLADDAGTFRLRGHLPLLPGDRLLVARNGSAVREEFGVVPDVDRMGLRLSNDGDVLRLLWGDDRVLDLVAWEGSMEGWEGLEAGEGEALIRRDGDARACCVAAWRVGGASLGR